MAIDPKAFVDSLDSKWNSQEVETALGAFTDDAVVRLLPAPPPPLPGVFTGKEQVRQFIQTFIPGFRVASTNFQAIGDHVTWNWTATSDQFQRMGADQASGMGEAVVDGTMVKEFTVTFDQQTLAKMQAAAQSATR